jgi:hypothetical protein
MVGHQAIGVHRAAEMTGAEAQKPQIRRVIIVAKEASAAIVAALSDVQRQLRHDDARATWHELATIRPMPR